MGWDGEEHELCCSDCERSPVSGFCTCNGSGNRRHCARIDGPKESIVGMGIVTKTRKKRKIICGLQVSPMPESQSCCLRQMCPIFRCFPIFSSHWPQRKCSTRLPCDRYPRSFVLASSHPWAQVVNVGKDNRRQSNLCAGHLSLGMEKKGWACTSPWTKVKE